MPIEPLSDDLVRQLAISATESAPLRPHEIDLVVTRANGSPLFVGELIAAAQELGSFDAVPESLQGTLAAQVDALDPLSKRMLSYASVLGRSFRRVVVDEQSSAAKGSNSTRRPLRSSASSSRQTDPSATASGTAWFATSCTTAWPTEHGLDCTSLPARRSRHCHRETTPRSRCCRCTSRTPRTTNAPTATRARAAERADRAHARSEAVIHYERAIEVARHLDVDDDDFRRLLLALGDAREQAGLLDAALEAYRRAGKVAGDDDVARARTYLLRARVREGMGTYTSAVGETTRGRAIAAAAGSSGDAVRAELLAYAAKIRTRQSRYEQARRIGLAAAELAEACGEPTALASAYHALLVAEVQLGRDEQAAEYARRADELYEALGDLEQQAVAANNLGMIAVLRQSVGRSPRMVRAVGRTRRRTRENALRRDQ